MSNKNCLKVVLFGPESTGKTTLAINLAQHYKTNYVPEYARGYLQEKWNKYKDICSLEDLPIIVKEQKILEKNILKDSLAKAEQDSKDPEISDQKKYLIDQKIDVLKSLTLN